MTIDSLIPAADTIPVPWGWLYFFLILTFVLHLLFMNVMLGSAVMAFVRDLRKKDADVVRDISGKLPYTIAFTVNLGVAPLLFVQVLYGQFMYVSSVLMAVYWLSVIGLLILFYYSAYCYSLEFDKMPAARTWFIGLAVILGLIVAFLFTNNMTLMIQPATWKEYFSNRFGTILNLGDPTLWPRYLHFVAASVAMGGLFQALLAKIRHDPRGRERKINLGMQWFFYATAAQLFIGFWFLISLPREVMLGFMGGDRLSTVLLVLSLAGVVLSLVFGFARRVWPAAGSVLVTIVLMALVRDFVRSACLKPYFRVSDLTVVPQYSPMIVFIMVLVIGLGLVAYMLNLAAKSKQEAQ